MGIGPRDLKPIGWVGEEGVRWYFDGPGEGEWSADYHALADLVHWRYRHRGAFVTQFLALEIWEDYPDDARTVLAEGADYLNRCVDRGWFSVDFKEGK